jgi:hypothetical protein
MPSNLINRYYIIKNRSEIATILIGCFVFLPFYIEVLKSAVSAQLVRCSMGIGITAFCHAAARHVSSEVSLESSSALPEVYLYFLPRLPLG